MTHEAQEFKAFGGLHPAGCNLNSHEAFRLVLFIRLGLKNLPRLILAQTFGHFRQRVTHEAQEFKAFGGLHPAGCNLNSHEAFRLVLFIRLGLKNLPRLILAQTFGHFRQRVTHEAQEFQVLPVGRLCGGRVIHRCDGRLFHNFRHRGYNAPSVQMANVPSQTSGYQNG